MDDKFEISGRDLLIVKTGEGTWRLSAGSAGERGTVRREDGELWVFPHGHEKKPGRWVDSLKEAEMYLCGWWDAHHYGDCDGCPLCACGNPLETGDSECTDCQHGRKRPDPLPRDVDVKRAEIAAEALADMERPGWPHEEGTEAAERQAEAHKREKAARLSDDFRAQLTQIMAEYDASTAEARKAKEGTLRGLLKPEPGSVCGYSPTHMENGVPATQVIYCGTAVGYVLACDDCAALYARLSGKAQS